MEFEIIELENIRALNFVELSQELVVEILSWRNHESVRKWMYNNKIIPLGEHLEFVHSLKEDNKNLYFLIQDYNKNGIGVISFNRINHQHKNAYIGIYANPLNTIKGIGRLLGDSLLNIGFEKLDLHTLKLEVLFDNERAIKFYKKTGFTEEGILKEFIYKEDHWIDVIVMGIVRNY